MVAKHDTQCGPLRGLLHVHGVPANKNACPALPRMLGVQAADMDSEQQCRRNQVSHIMKG
jgi:hypothetical protein